MSPGGQRHHSATERGLNPIRAGIAKTPEASEFTSIYDRIKLLSEEHNPRSRISLRSFSDEGQGGTATIPFRLYDYLALVDWSGRSIRAGKRGFIAADAPPILKRLNLDAEAWEVLMTRPRTLFGRAMGKVDAMQKNTHWTRTEYLGDSSS